MNYRPYSNSWSCIWPCDIDLPVKTDYFGMDTLCLGSQTHCSRHLEMRKHLETTILGRSLAAEMAAIECFLEA